MIMDSTNAISNVVVIGIQLFVWRSLDTRISQLDKCGGEPIAQLDEWVSEFEERIVHLGVRISPDRRPAWAFARISNSFATKQQA